MTRRTADGDHDAANFLTESSHVRCDGKKIGRDFFAPVSLRLAGNIAFTWEGKVKLQGPASAAATACMNQSLVLDRRGRGWETMGIILQPI